MNVWRNKEWVSYVAIAIFAVLILIAPYYRGLFFEVDMYRFELAFGLLFLAVLVVYYRTRTIEVFRTVTIYPLLLFVFVFFLSSLQGLTPQLAYDEFLRWLTYALVFVGLLVLLTPKKGEWVLHAIMLSIIWTSAFGLFAQFGWVEFKDAMLGARISSVLQYPNTLAAMVGAAIIGILMYSMRRNVHVVVRGLYLTQLVPLLVVFIYNQSRTTYIMFLVVWFVALFFMKVSEQIKYIVMTSVLVVSTLILLTDYDRYVADGDGRIVIIIFSVGAGYAIAMSIILWLSGKLRINKSRPAKSPYVRLVIPLILLVVIVVGFILMQSSAFISVFPEMIQKRMEKISLDERSLTSRLLFFKDSFDLFKDHWFIGAGGNAWKGLYYSYQSLPYTSTQTHGFLVKIMTDVGIIGSLLFVAFVGLILYTTYRWLRKYGLDHDSMLQLGVPFMMMLMIFLHSIFDFDMSYGYVSVVFFALAALMYIVVRDEDTEVRWSRKWSWVSKVGVWALVVPAIVFVINMGMYTYAASINFAGATYEEALDKVNTKVKLSPSNPEYRMQKIDVLDIAVSVTGEEVYRDEALQEALKLSELDKNNPITLLKLGQIFAKYGYGQNAVEVSQKALELAPWFIVAYEQNISFHYQIAVSYLEGGSIAESRKFLLLASHWLTELEEKIAHMAEQPKSLRNKQFTITVPIRTSGAKTLALIGEFERAKEYLTPLLKNKDEEVKLDAIVWMSIVEEKLGNAEQVQALLEQGREWSDIFDYERERILIQIEMLQ